MRVIRAALAALATAAVVSACSAAGTGGGAGVLSLPSTPATADASGAGPAPSPSASLDPRDAMLAYARCMREHGVDMPDPQPGANGGFSVALADPDDPSGADFEAAQKACADVLGNADGGVMGRALEITPEDQQRLVEYSECMREHGVEFPAPIVETRDGDGAPEDGSDPDGDDDGTAVGPRDAVGIFLDPNDPVWAAANDECKVLLPGGFLLPAGGPGSGPGASPAVPAP